MTGSAVINPTDGQHERAPHTGGRIYRYPRRALVAAYLRTGAGLVMIGIPMIYGNPGTVASVVLGGIALAFMAYGMRTWLRGMGRVQLNTDGISISGPFPAAVPWHELTGAKLSYYSTRRDNTSGWMQLNISGTHGKLVIESTLDGFADVTRRVIAETLARDIELSASTRNNLRPLGIQVGNLNAGSLGRVTDRRRV
jgi:hypothetical protein